MTRTSFLAVSILLLCAPSMAGQTLDFFGQISLQTISSDAPLPWIDGGFGRLQAGSDGTESADEALVGNVDLALEWLPSPDASVYVHGLVRGETQAVEEWSSGVVEAWGEYRFHLDSINEIKLRAGTMILPTSRENVGQFWSSPYLISFSAINSWIAEEIRPTGIDLQYRWDDGTKSFRIAGTPFVANDTAGTLLAWRGWDIGNRLTTFGETLPLPPLHSLPDKFPQQGPGTTPYGEDLDGRIGWSARARFDWWSHLTAQATHFDNRANRELHGDEYAWHTRFDLVAFEYQPAESLTIASEYMRGSTKMGPLVGARVEADFAAAYALLSWKVKWFRLSGRYDWFETIDRDLSEAENNDENGTAIAGAVAIEPTANLRFALELLDVDVEREAAAASGAPAQNGGDAILFQFRYSF